MTAVYKFRLRKKIRLGQWLSLIFFVCLLAESCRQKEADIAIVWKGKQAIGLTVSETLTDEVPGSFSAMQIRLKGNTDRMLGSYEHVDGRILFTPLVPLTAGADYEVLCKNKLIGSVKIPAADAATAAYVVNIYPAVDTVPMNLLKIYVQFSAPMREGEALRHIYLVNGQRERDTVPNIFLDLQPELWDSTRKLLTVWLDPGRIKRHLIPNQQMGNPLQPSKHYKIVINNNWKDAQGLPLRQTFSKAFVAGDRDSMSPQPQQWKIELPTANTKEELGIYFGESLDYFLTQETIIIIDSTGNMISGKSISLNNGTGNTFWPEKPWQPGKYKLRIASVLEDLAGNNLNRVFDRDLGVKATNKNSDFVEKLFIIEAIK